MDNTKQFLAMAALLGWEPVEFDGFGRWKRNGERTRQHPPNWRDDLNATHEAERELLEHASPQFIAEWERHIRQITLRDGRDGSSLYERIIRATAPQRVEAILRTTGKWEA